MVLLNQGEKFAVTRNERSSEYEPIDQEEKWEYIRDELKDCKYAYESVKKPTLDELTPLLTDAVRHFEKNDPLSGSRPTRWYISR